jgi:hypothetical protein
VAPFSEGLATADEVDVFREGLVTILVEAVFVDVEFAFIVVVMLAETAASVALF